jgi:uncharacterized Zn finger protein
MSWYGGFAPYVPVAQRRAKAAAFAAKLAKKESRALCPVKVEGRKIVHTFWGQAWHDNLERYSDFANRLPRGLTYVRNGSVIDLQIASGQIKAIVSGSEIYHITIKIDTLPSAHWNRIKRECSQSIASLMDLLQGRFDEGVMKRLTHRDGGLFPHPKETKMRCSCPDSAMLCKHLAAVMYGVGARLDSDPELLFTLRNVDHLEMVSTAVAAGNLDQTLRGGKGTALAGDLGEIFGIDIDSNTPSTKPAGRRKQPVGPPKQATSAGRNSKVVAVVKTTSTRTKRPVPKTAPRSATASAKRTKK